MTLICVCVSVWARMHAPKCICLCRLVCVFRLARTGDEGFKLTEHASASACLNYHTIKRIQGVALEVRAGINVCLKDDSSSAWINSPTLEKSIASEYICVTLGKKEVKTQFRSRFRQYTSK